MRNFTKALIAVIIVTLLLGGIVYAYETIWSGKARITIEAPASAGQLEVTDIEARFNGTWDDSTDTWTVSIARGQGAQLKISLRNIGGDVATCYAYINGEQVSSPHTYIASGVYVSFIPIPPIVLAANESGSIIYCVEAEADAEPGTLPEIDLEIIQ